MRRTTTTPTSSIRPPSSFCGIAENQPFVDGNKRIALVVALTFLELNGYATDMTEDEMFELMLDISAGLSPTNVAARLRRRLRRMDTAD